MLFSSPEVAESINATFEPAWESVRPVPLVSIDFGNGRTVRRTLQGNVATYICDPDGRVFDVLPGSYDPVTYRRQLAACRELVGTVRPAGDTTDADLAARLRDHHTKQAAHLMTLPTTPRMVQIAQMGGGIKGGIGGFGGVQFQGGFGGQQFQGGIGGQPAPKGIGGGFGGIEAPTERLIAGTLATRPELALDSRVNDTIRRRAIHERLAGSGLVRPDDIKKWLFKDVLHADLDDPLLGLGGLLYDNYPFAAEDRAAGR